MTARGAASKLLVGAMGLAAASCSDPVTALKPLTVDAARSASVGMVTIVNQSASATTENLTDLQTELVTQASRCATGPIRYDMVVQVQNFRRGDWMLVSAPYALTGRVVLVDPVNNTVAATYYVEAGQASQFARRVCRDVFDSGN
jgi:hypothetical protein